MKHDPNRKGNAAELAIAAEAARLGLEVWHPLTEHGRADLILGIDGQMVRVQCKWARRRGDVIFVPLQTSRRGRDGYVRSCYNAREIDAVGAYCDELNSCFLIPIGVAEDKAAISLRLAPARNGQRAALHWAEQYRLGAVAQLEERRHGMAEVRGSSPLSSTSQAESTTSVEEVGAHQFRNQFGYYLDRASAGSEILVRRWGRPYASLCPPARRTRLRSAPWTGCLADPVLAGDADVK
jgi:PD-(D/E)XK nuclease superfamily protein